MCNYRPPTKHDGRLFFYRCLSVNRGGGTPVCGSRALPSLWSHVLLWGYPSRWSHVLSGWGTPVLAGGIPQDWVIPPPARTRFLARTGVPPPAGTGVPLARTEVTPLPQLGLWYPLALVTLRAVCLLRFPAGLSCYLYVAMNEDQTPVQAKDTILCGKQKHFHTRKSSCVTARGVPPATYPVHSVSYPEGEGYPCPGPDLGEWEGGTPVLVLSWGGGVHPLLVLTWVPPPLHLPWKGSGTIDWSTPSTPLPWERTRDQRLGHPFPPLERTWDQRPEVPPPLPSSPPGNCKGPETGVPNPLPRKDPRPETRGTPPLPPHPPYRWTNKLKTLPSFVLPMWAVITVNLKICHLPCSRDILLFQAEKVGRWKDLYWLLTARVRSTTGICYFHRCLSVHTQGGGLWFNHTGLLRNRNWHWDQNQHNRKQWDSGPCVM